MKRHLNALLQRKHTEFESSREAHRSPRSVDPDEATATGIKDGYDWLALIRVNRAVQVSAHG
ncbi:hypothetical protein [Rhodanobacter koreensis]